MKVFFFTPRAFLRCVVSLVLHLAFHTELLLSDILSVNGKQKAEGFMQKDLHDWTDDPSYRNFR